MQMADYGMDASPARDLAAENVEFEASYMTIFQGYLVLGVLIGSAGIAVIVFRSASERRWEIGVLKSLGLSNRDVGLAFILEATLISVPGIIIGTVAGLISAYLSFSIWGEKDLKLPIGGNKRLCVILGNRGSGPDTLCVLDENHLDPKKDFLVIALQARDPSGPLETAAEQQNNRKQKCSLDAHD